MQSSIEQRYPALRAISGVYKLLAWLSAIGGALGLVVGLMMAAKEPAVGAGIAIGALVYGVVGLLTFLAIAEALKVFVDIEHNTRAQLETLRERPATGG